MKHHTSGLSSGLEDSQLYSTTTTGTLKSQTENKTKCNNTMGLQPFKYFLELFKVEERRGF